MMLLLKCASSMQIPKVFSSVNKTEVKATKASLVIFLLSSKSYKSSGIFIRILIILRKILIQQNYS